MLRDERYFGNMYRPRPTSVELDWSASKATSDDGILKLKLVEKAAAPGRAGYPVTRDELKGLRSAKWQLPYSRLRAAGSSDVGVAGP